MDTVSLALQVIGVLIVIAIVLFLVTSLGEGTETGRFIKKNNHKIKSPKFSKKELDIQRQGVYTEIGTDKNTNDPVIIPEATRHYSFLIIGPPGTGKTTLLRSEKSFWEQDISHPDASVFIMDGQKTETENIIALCKKYGKEYVVLPDDGFNPLAGEGTAEERAAAFSDLFAQTYDIAGDGVHFTNMVRLYIESIFPVFEVVTGEPMILQDLLAVSANAEYRATLLKLAAGSTEAEDYTLRVGGWERSEFKTNLLGLVSYISRLTSGGRAWTLNQRYAPTLKDLIDGVKPKVIICREGGPKGTVRRAAGLSFMIALQEYVEKRQSDARYLGLYLDEAHFYLNVNYETFIATARKKRCVQHLGIQSFEQLGDYKNIILTSIGTWIPLNRLYYEDALIVANQIGKVDYTDFSTSTSQEKILTRESVSRSTVRDFLIHPETIQKMGKNEALVLSVIDREIRNPVFVKRPVPLKIQTEPYISSTVPNHAPPTYFQEHPEKFTIKSQEPPKKQVQQTIMPVTPKPNPNQNNPSKAQKSKPNNFVAKPKQNQPFSKDAQDFQNLLTSKNNKGALEISSQDASEGKGNRGNKRDGNQDRGNNSQEAEG